jgi:hypothetical protein
MRIGLYLTCQGRLIEAIRDFLPGNVKIFYEENYKLFARNASPTREWEDLDYFIYQPIESPPRTKYADSEVIGNYVCPRATLIRVPYLMFTGLTPWRFNNANVRLGTEHGISWIHTLSLDELDEPDALRRVLEREDDSIEALAQDSLKILAEKEAASDLSGVATWIEERVRDIDLFWTPNHPRGILAREFCNRILTLMELPALPESTTAILDGVLAVERTPIFPGVARRLKLRHYCNIAFGVDGPLETVPSYVARYARAVMEIRRSVAPIQMSNISEGILP